LSSIAENLVDRVPGSDSTSDLYFDVRHAKYGPDLRSVVATSGHCVEVNNVEVTKAVLSPRDSNPDWIGDADHFLVVRASGKLYARTAAEVKRGNCDHRSRTGKRAQIMRGKTAVTIAC
jgi:hypothetical protein